MSDHSRLFERVRKRTGMYVPDETYNSVAAFVLGYDLACEGGPLMGFREWLVLREPSGANLMWSALVLQIAFPEAGDPRRELNSPTAERHAIDTLFDLIAEFDQVRAQRDGLKKIFLASAADEQS